MRPYPTLLLARMLLRFFSRRVLSFGALRSRALRWLAGAGCVALSAVCSLAAYRFLEPVAGRPDVWSLLFQLVTVSVVLWVQVAFLFVKVLFLNAEGMLQLTFQLPLTTKERIGALLVYESVMVAVVTTVGSGAVCVAAVLLLGVQAVPLLVEAVVLPTAVTYLVLTVVHLALGCILGVLRARRIAPIICLLVQFGLLVTYAGQVEQLSSDIATAHLSGRDGVVWVGALHTFRDRHGWVAMGLAAVAVMTVLVLAVLALTPRHHVPQSRYLPLPARGRGGLWLAYDLCLVRSSHTLLTSVVALAALISLCLRPVINPLWGLSLSSMAGLYHFAATEPLRVIELDRGRPWLVYGRLIRGQLMLLMALGTPSVVVVELVTTETFGATVQALAGCVGGVLLATTIGVLFPAEHDNPFSVFIGLSLAAVVLGIVGVGVGIVQLPERAVQACLLAALAVSVWYGVLGVGISERRRRHEEVPAHGQQHRRRRPAHPGRRRRDAALPHVLRG